MKKGKIISYIIIIISIVLTLTGIVVWQTQRKDNKLEENTVINISGETSETLKAEMYGFYPGKTMDYVISLTGDTAEEYSVTLDFFGDNGGQLKNFLLVEILTDNGTISKPLQELLDGELLSLGKRVTEITISYTMPIDTGDEAQGTSVEFYIELNARNVE